MLALRPRHRTISFARPLHNDSNAYVEAAAQWIQEVTGTSLIAEGTASSIMDSLYQTLRTGEVLCEMINCICPGTIAKIQRQGTAFRERENIVSFLRASREMGVQEYALFSIDDLYEQRNMFSVVRCIHALGGAVQRTIPDFHGPHLGVQDEANCGVRRSADTPRPASSSGYYGGMTPRTNIHIYSPYSASI
jgi:hypothetical protein